MFFAHVLHMTQPIVAQAQPVAADDRFDAAAAIVSAHDDMAHFQNFDRELKHRETIQIRMHHDVRDVAMHEKFAGSRSTISFGGDPAVRPADPQIGGGLLARQLQKKFRILLLDAAAHARLLANK